MSAKVKALLLRLTKFTTTVEGTVLHPVFPSIKLCLASLLLPVFLTACTVSSGHTENRDFGKYMRLKIGESDKHAVYKEFRQPIDAYTTPSGSTWIYLSEDSETHFSTFIPVIGLFTGGGINTIYTTYMHFDENGILSDVQSSTEEDYVNMWEGAAVLTAEAVSGRWSDAKNGVKAEMATLGYPYQSRSQLDLPPRIDEQGIPVSSSD